MFSAADRTEAVNVMNRYVELLQGKGQMGRQTLRDLEKVLKYKADVIDRRYVKCVSFPEKSKGARIPAPHTMYTGIWKIVTEIEYVADAPADKAGGIPSVKDLGILVDLEIGAKNTQCCYLYDVTRGSFASNPKRIINGRGLSLDIENGKVKTDGGNMLDFASIDPVSIYYRYRLVAASIAILPVSIRNPLAEIALAQIDDFELPLKSAENSTDSPYSGEVFVQYLTSPITTMQNLLTINPKGPFVKVYKTDDSETPTVGSLAATVTLEDVFGTYGKTGALVKVDKSARIGNKMAWTEDFELDGTDKSGILTRWFGIGVRRWEKPGGFLSYTPANEQLKTQMALVNDNSNVINAIAAFNSVMNKVIDGKSARSQEEFMAFKLEKATDWLESMQNTAPSIEIFETARSLIESMFPMLCVPVERSRRTMSKAKVLESPYQIRSSLSAGSRMIYIPRSSKALQFRDPVEVFEDKLKDVFIAVTTGLMEGDQVKIVITRHFEGLPNGQLAPYLALDKTVPDAKTLEMVDRLASLAPDLITVPPGKVEEMYASVKDTLGFLIIGDNPVESKTSTALRNQVLYDQELRGNAS